VARVAEQFERSPDLGALFGSYDSSPSSHRVVSRWRNLLHHWVHQRSDPEATTFWAGCGAFRRSTFVSLGGFDEGFEAPSVEDIELGYRATLAGCRIRLDASLLVRHHKVWSLRDVIRTDILRRAAPWTELLFTRRQLRTDLNLRAGDRFALLATWAALGFGLLVPWLGAQAALACSMAAGLALLPDASFFAFLFKTGGIRLAVAAMPLQLLHRLCSGIGLGLGLCRVLLNRSSRGPEALRGAAWFDRGQQAAPCTERLESEDSA